MYDLIARPLAFFYSVWPSYAGSIVLLTLSIMVVLTPLTLKGTRSMLAMQRLQPEMKRLQAKYKDDRQKLNEEMLKFYKENGINPMSGCLPLLLQMPVFFFLYRTLIGLTTKAPYGADMGSAAAAGTQNAVFSSFGVFHPKNLDKTTNLYQSLHSARAMNSWGVNLADSASGALGRGVGSAAPYLVLVLAVAGTSYIQQKQVSGRTPQAAQINPQQQMLLKLMPAFFAFISLGLPAGVVLYFFVSNLYRIGQQAFITRTMYGDGGVLQTTATETPKSTPDPAPAGRKGLLSSLGLDRSTPDEPPPAKGRSDGTKAKPKPAAAAKAQKPTPSRAKPRETGRPARGAAARPGGSGSSAARGRGRANRPVDADPVAKNGDGGREISTGSTNGQSKRPSRQGPPVPPNRSRTKKKRK